MFTKTVLLAAFAGLAISSPLESRQIPQNDFSLNAVAAGVANVDGAVINAKGQAFNLNDGNQRYCPESDVLCKDRTIETIFSYQKDTQHLFLKTGGNSGQQVFVGTDGSLGFTAPGSGAGPFGSQAGPFEFAGGELKYNGDSFAACLDKNADPTKNIYKIFIASVIIPGSGCVGITTTAHTFSGTPAFEYQ